MRQDIEYVDMLHHMTSMHLVGAANCHDHYDTIFCVGPHQVAETRASERLRGVPAKNLVPVGYDLLDRERAEFAARRPARGRHFKSAPAVAPAGRPMALVAPSWQDDNLLDLCGEEAVRSLVGAGFSVVVRPHPEYVKRYGPAGRLLKGRLADVSGSVSFEDFSGEGSIFDASVLVTDWSSISCSTRSPRGVPRSSWTRR